MIPITRFFTVLAAVGALSVAATGVQAQQPAQNARPQQDLPALLHLKPEQESAWRAYQAASQPRQDEIGRMQAASPQALAGLPTPQRLDRIGTFLTLQTQMFHRAAEATRAFYAQLSPEQQRTFDQVTAPPAQGRSRPQG